MEYLVLLCRLQAEFRMLSIFKTGSVSPNLLKLMAPNGSVALEWISKVKPP
jgi:hypothetical protein